MPALFSLRINGLTGIKLAFRIGAINAVSYSINKLFLIARKGQNKDEKETFIIGYTRLFHHEAVQGVCSSYLG